MLITILRCQIGTSSLALGTFVAFAGHLPSLNKGEIMPSTNPPVPVDPIATKIHVIRGQKVMLDSDLAELYGVETKYLLRQVTRNADRFPTDFMFLIENKEVTRLRCQIGTSKGRGGRRYSPYVFTEQGVAMLSGVLRSKRAIQVNILIMRTFPQLRLNKPK
jgi:hypothetical protein